MRRQLGVALLAASLAAGGQANAAVPGHALSVERHCDDGLVSITGDASLSGAVDVQGATSAVIRGGETVNVSAACGGSRLELRVPPHFPVTVDAAGSGTVRLEDLAGPLTVSMRDDVALEAGRLGGQVVLSLNGNGDAHVGTLSGPAVVNIAGSSDLAIGKVDTKAFALTDAGSGDVAIRGGRIGSLHATLSGSGDLRVDGTVGGGEVVTGGSGDVFIARVLGNLVEVQTGSGTISVGDRGGEADEAATTPSRRPGLAFGLGPLTTLPPIALVLFAVLFVGSRRRQGRSATPPANGADPRIEAALERLSGVSRRVGRVEALVTSAEFELERRFRELGD